MASETRLIVGKLRVIYHDNRAFYDTNMKLGTQVELNILKKIRSESQSQFAPKCYF